MMEKLEIIDLIVQLHFTEASFIKLIDPAARIEKEKRERYWQDFEKLEQNLLSFYKSLGNAGSDGHYIRDSINHYVDHKIRARFQHLQSDTTRAEAGDKKKIKPIDDLDGSESWGFNDDVKWK